jgi:hypothetical protein
MAILCFDPIGGASGDMVLASLFALGAPAADVVAAPRSTGLAEFDIHFERRQDENGIVCGFCEVRTEKGGGEDGGGHSHGRHLGEILEMIRGGRFAKRAKERAGRVFHRLAEAEGAVHGIPPEAVHFHEVGAVDSIVDIVGACLALEFLGVDSVHCSELKIGSGTVRCQHGILPVPAPATARLIEGHAVRRLAVESELTTPTGAALLTTLSQGPWNDLPLSSVRIGAGHGRRHHEGVPNLLRAYLAQTAGPAAEMLALLEADVDDDTGERLAHAAEGLRQAGALDVVLLPVQMKKGRPGTRLHVLCTLSREADIARLLLDESGTIGVRRQVVSRYALPRERGTVATRWGSVGVKIVRRPSGAEAVPEYEDCRAVAERAGVPWRRVMAEAAAAGVTMDGQGANGLSQ